MSRAVYAVKIMNESRAETHKIIGNSNLLNYEELALMKEQTELKREEMELKERSLRNEVHLRKE